LLVSGQKKHSKGEIGGINTDTLLRKFAQQQCMGKLSQHTSTIARFRIIGNRPTMSEVRKRLKRHTKDIVSRATIDTRHKAYSTTIVFKAWVIEAILAKFISW
jgi:hypothetical protein